MDKDYSDGVDDLLDKLIYTFYLSPGTSKTITINGTRPIADNKSQFTLTVSVTCFTNWTGTNCSIGKNHQFLA